MNKGIKMCCVFAVVISLSACNVEESTENPGLETNAPLITEAPVETINIYRPPTQNMVTYKYLDEWENNMYETFGVNLKIHNISPMYQTDIALASYYPRAIENGDIEGIIEIKQWEINNLIALKEADLILPLDEYLKDNYAYQSLPEVMRKAFVMPDGQTWAIATNSPFGLFSRKLKKSWMEKLDMNVPTNLDELFEIMKRFTYDDPNGNGINDEHGIDVLTRWSSRMLLDIFIANDCYLSNYANSSIAYDYSTDAFEDAILKPGMLKSLEYIKGMHDNGFLFQNASYDFLKGENSGNFMSLSPNTDYRLIDINEWHEIYTLSDNNISIMGLRPYKMFVLTSNTESPKQTINKFVDIFLTDAQGMANGTYGIEDKNYTFEDNVLKAIMNGTDLSTYSSEFIALTNINFYNIIDEDITLVDPQWIDFSIPGIIRETKLYAQFYNEGKLFFDSSFMYSTKDRNISEKFSASFGAFIQDIDNISPQEFIDNYKKNAKISGWQNVLDELNTESEKTASYRYD